jgi:hypothetical protein
MWVGAQQLPASTTWSARSAQPLRSYGIVVGDDCRVLIALSCSSLPQGMLREASQRNRIVMLNPSTMLRTGSVKHLYGGTMEGHVS